MAQVLRQRDLRAGQDHAPSDLSSPGGAGDNPTMTKTVVIDLSNVTRQSELHALLAESLSFPPFYGKNWDAFWDSITGLVEMPEVLELRGIEKLHRALPEDAAHLTTLLNDLGEAHPQIRCEVRYVR